MITINRQEFFKKGLLFITSTMGLTGILNAFNLSDMTKPLFISPAMGETFQLPHIKITVKVSDKDTEGNYSIFEEITEPGFGTPLHTHEKQWEIIEVLEGKYKIRANDEVHITEAGGIAIIPPNTPHAYINVDPQASKFRFMLSPGLNFEGFVKEMSEFKELPPKEKLAELLKKYGMDLVGPPLNVD